MPIFDIIAFDADDTLWHNETLYHATQLQFYELLSPYLDPEQAARRLYETEMRNLSLFGYGIKAFTLSMIETAIAVSGGGISGAQIQKIIDCARNMMVSKIELFDHVEETVKQLAAAFPLMLVTKGDLLDQENKLARSGLAPYFNHVEIVSDKTPESYAALLKQHAISPARFLMVGNSLRSDILPVLAVGGRAVYIPFHLTWAHENDVDRASSPQSYVELEHIGLLADWIRQQEAPTQAPKPRNS